MTAHGSSDAPDPMSSASTLHTSSDSVQTERPTARQLPNWMTATSCCLRRNLLVEAGILDVEHSSSVAVGCTSTTSAGSADISSFNHESALISFLPDANI